MRKLDVFKSSGTWTVPVGVTHAVATILGGGGGVCDGEGAAGTGGTSSVAFSSGTQSSVGGGGWTFGRAGYTASVTVAGTDNSGQGAQSGAQNKGYGQLSHIFGGRGSMKVVSADVTAGASITVTVGAGGNGGPNGAAGGSGIVLIEYEVN